MTRPVSIDRLSLPRTLVQTVEAGSFEAVAIDTLQFDRVIQRHLNTAWVEARTYDMVKSGTIICSRRKSGAIFVVDGQHRVMMAKRSGETHVLAQVLENLTKQQEAELRLAFNDRRGDTALEKFAARIAAGDGIAIAIRTLVVKAGGKIARTSSATGSVNAVAALEVVYAFDEGRTLITTLDVIREAFGVLDGTTVTVASARGVAHFVRAHGGPSERKRLIERMTEQGSLVIRHKAHAHRMALGGTEWINYYRALLEGYNARLRPASRLQWVDPHGLPVASS